jgi:Protein of unknown function (DUF3017)
VLIRARRYLGEQFAFLIVLAGMLAAFGALIVAPGHWRRGTAVIAAAMLSAALLRLVLPPARVGMLAVRGRVTDVVCFVVLGGVILGADLRLHT